MFRPYFIVGLRTLRRLHVRRDYQTEIKSTYKKLNKPRSLLIVSSGSVLAYIGGSLILGGEDFYKNHAMPAIHSLLDGEDAHRLAIAMAKWKLVPLDIMVSLVFVCTLQDLF